MKLRILTIIFIILSAIGYSYYQKKSLDQSLATQSMTLLEYFPFAAQFKTLDGELVSFDLFRSSTAKALVIHYWGSWCAPCEEELPELLEFIKSQPDVDFWLVAVDDEISKIKKFLDKMNPYSTKNLFWLMDDLKQYRELFGTTKVPESLIFDQEARMIRKFMGPQDWSTQEFIDFFNQF